MSSNKDEVTPAAAAAAPEAEAPLHTVPETLLKKRKRDEQWALARKEQLQEAKVRNAKNRKVIFKRAEQYIKEYRQQVSAPGAVVVV